MVRKNKNSEEEKKSKREKFNPVLDKDTPKKVKVNPKFKVDREGGWKEKKPHTKKERKDLLNKCGNDSFLLPKHLKFPICNKITEKNHQCTYNCAGLKAASSRAGEWKYKNVLKNSKKLTEELGCYKNKKPIEMKKQKPEMKKQKPEKQKPEKQKIEKKKPEQEKKGIFSKLFSIF